MEATPKIHQTTNIEPTIRHSVAPDNAATGSPRPESNIYPHNHASAFVAPLLSTGANRSSNLDVGDLLLKRFSLKSELGSGGSSRVFRTHDLVANESSHSTTDTNDLAIKVAGNLETASAGCSLLLRNELAIARSLNHPNLVRIYEYYETDKVSFLTMELIEGQTLHEIAQLYPKSIVNYERVKCVIDSVVSALVYCHKAGVIHSDIKPDNILVTANGQIKIIDFASARRLKTKAQHSDTNAPLRTGYHTYTLAYASPQLLKDAAPNIGDDIYSLGCVIYELLSGQLANANQLASKTIGQVGNDSMKSSAVTCPNKSGHRQIRFRPTKQRHRPAALSSWQWRILQRAMCKQGCQRFSSVGQFWWWFKFAGRFTSLVILASLCIAMLIALSGYRFYQFQNHVKQPIIANEPSSSTTDDIRSIDQAINRVVYGDQPLLDRLNRLNHLLAEHSTTDANTAAHLVAQTAQVVAQTAQAKISLLVEIEKQQRDLMNVDLDGIETPPFDQLQATLIAAERLFPDSLQLHQTKQILAEKKRQYTNLLELNYRSLWQDTKHSIPDAIAIDSVLRRLRMMGSTLPSTADSNVQSLHTQLKLAIERSDYRKFFTLYAFAQTITEHNPLQEYLAQLDDNYIIAAEHLLDYHGVNTDSTDIENYPQKSASVWLQPRLTEINIALDNVWKDRELRAITTDLQQLAETYKTDISNPALQHTLTLLKDKYRLKINFYRQRGFAKSQANLQADFSRLTAIKNQTTRAQLQ